MHVVAEIRAGEGVSDKMNQNANFRTQRGPRMKALSQWGNFHSSTCRYQLLLVSEPVCAPVSTQPRWVLGVHRAHALKMGVTPHPSLWLKPIVVGRVPKGVTTPARHPCLARKMLIYKAYTSWRWIPVMLCFKNINKYISIYEIVNFQDIWCLNNGAFRLDKNQIFMRRQYCQAPPGLACRL